MVKKNKNKENKDKEKVNDDNVTIINDDKVTSNNAKDNVTITNDDKVTSNNAKDDDKVKDNKVINNINKNDSIPITEQDNQKLVTLPINIDCVSSTLIHSEVKVLDVIEPPCRDRSSALVEVVKRKKGRPRKEVVELPDKLNVPEEKKKRGRKKKEVVVEEIKKKKKRGRKAAVKYFSSSIRKKIPLTTVLQDKNNYILHLDIKDEKEHEKEHEKENQKEDTQVYEKDSMNYSTEIHRNDSSLQESQNWSTLENEYDKPEIDKPEIDNPEIDNLVFEKLKAENKENITELQKEYDELLEKEHVILNETNDENLVDLYEKRIEFREHQDTVLVNKLETIHKDIDIYDKINLSSFSEDKNVHFESSETRNKKDNKKRGFFEIMHEFIHNTNWLDKTDISCWWCCHEFQSVPIGLPIKYDNNKKKFHVKGVFCSFSCMLAYKNDTKFKYSNHLINFLYTKLTGTFLLDVNIVPAPPRCSLKMFGGELNIEDFRNSFKENKIFKMIEYPMFICNDYIEEVDIQNVKRVNQNVFSDSIINSSKSFNLDEKRIEDAKNRLYQIEKSTITLGNTIDKFIKIT